MFSSMENPINIDIILIQSFSKKSAPNAYCTGYNSLWQWRGCVVKLNGLMSKVEYGQNGWSPYVMYF